MKKAISPSWLNFFIQKYSVNNQKQQTQKKRALTPKNYNLVQNHFRCWMKKSLFVDSMLQYKNNLLNLQIIKYNSEQNTQLNICHRFSYYTTTFLISNI